MRSKDIDKIMIGLKREPGVTPLEGEAGITVVELYNDGELRLEELRVMLGDQCVARSWRQYNGDEKCEGGSTDQTYYSLPKWYERYKKINEIL